MLKSISNLGKVLNKTEQQSINGGGFLPKGCIKPWNDTFTTPDFDCPGSLVYCDGKCV